MKKLIMAWLVVGLSVGWSVSASALDPIHHVIAFDTSSGTTTLKSQFTANSRTRMISVVPTGSGVFVTYDNNTTTPVKDKHVRLTEDLEYLYSISHGEKITFTGDGVSAGWLNVIEFSTWAWPY